MNDTQIAKLLTRRNRLLTRRDGLYDHAIIDRIDRQLAEVPAGVNNEVDLALGRACAKLPERYAPPLDVETRLKIAEVIDRHTSTVRDGWPTPAQNKATVAEAMPEAARMAEAMCAAFMAHQAERGLGCAGNSADEYDSSTEGHW